MEIKRFFHENKLGLCGVGITAGLPLTIISIMSLLFSEGDTGMILWSYDLVGNWAFWFVIPGLVMIIFGSYYLYDFFRKLKEFNNLMETKSKAKFIKNIDRVEELAWRLHPRYERLVIERKKKYKIR